jgi:hypothetical protein
LPEAHRRRTRVRDDVTFSPIGTGKRHIVAKDVGAACGQPVDEDVARRLLVRNGEQQDVEDWREGDVVTLRNLRAGLTAVFEAAVEDPDRAVLLLDRWLAELPAVPQLAADPDGGWAITVASKGHVVTALETRLPAALARFVVRWGRGGSAAARPTRAAAPTSIAPRRAPAGTAASCATTGWRRPPTGVADGRSRLLSVTT